jgi:hypothetical protein
MRSTSRCVGMAVSGRSEDFLTADISFVPLGQVRADRTLRESVIGRTRQRAGPQRSTAREGQSVAQRRSNRMMLLEHGGEGTGRTRIDMKRHTFARREERFENGRGILGGTMAPKMAIRFGAFGSISCGNDKESHIQCVKSHFSILSCSDCHGLPHLFPWHPRRRIVTERNWVDSVLQRFHPFVFRFAICAA